MSAKMTLEEIEALAKGATPGPWKTVIPNPEEGWIDVVAEDGSMVVGDQGVYNGLELEPTAALIAAAPRLLEIAQEQAGAIRADDERLEKAAVRIWGEHVMGCDTAERMADLIEHLRAQIDTHQKVST